MESISSRDSALDTAMHICLPPALFFLCQNANNTVTRPISYQEQVKLYGRRTRNSGQDLQSVFVDDFAPEQSLRNAMQLRPPDVDSLRGASNTSLCSSLSHNVETWRLRQFFLTRQCPPAYLRSSRCSLPAAPRRYRWWEPTRGGVGDTS